MTVQPDAFEGTTPVVRYGPSAPTIPPITVSSCSPVLNALLSSIGFEKGPLTVPSIPSGRKGLAKKIRHRPVIATEPSSLSPSLAAASAYLPSPFARSRDPAAGLLKNVADRAF